MRAVLAVMALAACVAVSSATTGVDVSQLFAVSAWQCVRNYGYKFAIVRCFCSNGNPDHNCAQSVANAWAAGFEHVDIYMFPCPQCGNARLQVQRLYEHSRNIRFGQMWLDIEGSQYWLGNVASNRAFFNELAKASQDFFGSKLGGVYTNKVQWDAIMGSWTGASNMRLWWAYWDFSPSWSGWAPFGGWSSPAIKQYAGDQSFCGMGVDKNFY